MKKEHVLMKKSNKKIVVLIIIIFIVFIVVGILLTFNISSTNKEKILQEQLDLGNKYLNELNYEQAIIAYETAIEIDPMSVDAYLGLSFAHEQQGNYDKALEVLELGYEKTQSDVILQEIERIQAIISQGDYAQTDLSALETDSEYPLVVPERVVEGIYHNPYYEYPLSTEDKEYLVQIIEQAEQSNYEAALNMVDNDRLIAIVETFADGESYINAMVDDKKVHILINVFDNRQQFYQNVEVIILPLNNGQGYYLEKNINRDNNGFENGEYVDSDGVCYGYGECKEGVFWGNFNWKMTRVDTRGLSEEEISTNTYITEGNVSLVNGLYDGQCTQYYWDDYDNTTNALVQTYDMGLIKYWNLQEGNYEGYNFFTFAWGYDANGDEVSISSSGSLAWLDTTRHTILRFDNYEDYREIDGGWRYYYW